MRRNGFLNQVQIAGSGKALALGRPRVNDFYAASRPRAYNFGWHWRWVFF